jgi:hypothetical protein
MFALISFPSKGTLIKQLEAYQRYQSAYNTHTHKNYLSYLKNEPHQFISRGKSFKFWFHFPYNDN